MITRLGEVCSFQAGSAFPQSEQGALRGDYPFAKVRDLSGMVGSRWGGISNWITESQRKRLRAKVIPAGAIVFAKIGEGLKSERLAIAPQPMLIDNNMMAAIAKKDKADPRWLYYAISTLGISSVAVGSALPYLKQSDLNELSVAVPELHVQTAIGFLLGALDDKIAANGRAIRGGRELLITRWEQQAEHSDEIVALDEVVNINPKGLRPGEGDIPFLDMKNLPEFGLLVESWTTRDSASGTRFQNGDTLVGRITPCFENGKMAFVDFLDDNEVGCGSTEYIVLRAKSGVPEIIPYVIAASNNFRDFAFSTRVGTSGRQRVQPGPLSEWELAWPNPDRLAEFGEFSQALVKRLGAARDENQRLAATRDELLPLLMNGTLTIKDAEKRVEEVA